MSSSQQLVTIQSLQNASMRFISFVGNTYSLSTWTGGGSIIPKTMGHDSTYPAACGQMDFVFTPYNPEGLRQFSMSSFPESSGCSLCKGMSTSLLSFQP